MNPKNIANKRLGQKLLKLLTDINEKLTNTNIKLKNKK